MSSRWALCAPDGASVGRQFEDLFLPHLNAAYSLARFIARDPVAADDIVQESFLRAFRSFGKFRGGDARTWLLAIVRNCSFDWSKTTRRAAGVTTDTVTSAAAERDNAGDSFGDLLDRWIPNPDELGDYTQDGPETAVSYKQIAEVTGVPVGTVMSRLARARQMLTEDLEQTR
jgi:RNA polymerase sigma factor (sigma-70 family)